MSKFNPYDLFFEWFFLPIAVAVVLHLGVWLIGSFVMWDLFWLSAFGHRVMLVCFAVFVWSCRISDAEDGNQGGQITPSAPTAPQLPKPKR